MQLLKRIRQYSDDKKCTFVKNGNIVAMEKRKGKLFVMKFKVITDDHQENMAVCNSPFFWHKRMAHQNVNQVKKILRSSRTSSSKNIIFKDQKFCCENCIIGKHRLPFLKNDTKSKLGKLIHVFQVQCKKIRLEKLDIP